MKLIVQIPAYNEEKNLAQTIRDIPRRIPGIDSVEILVIDDGSTDETVRVAKDSGADHLVRNICNKGLALTFLVGLDASLRLGADIIVNTDGDNQYKGSDIPKLVAPIVAGRAELVIGNRQTDRIPHFSFAKKKLQKLGSWMVRVLSDTDVPDAVSGFRAFSRNAALQMNIVSAYSYTIETIIQAGKKRLAVESVAIDTNPKTRESHLFKSIPTFVISQFNTLVRMYTMYQPLRVFYILSSVFLLGGLLPSFRYLHFYLNNQGEGHIQSLILAAVFYIVGFQLLVLGILGDVISFNRRLIEKTLLRVKRIELDLLKDRKN